MRLQHMLAMAEGYTLSGEHQGELDFFFRHQMSAERLVFLKVTLIRDITGGWEIQCEAQDGDKAYDDKAECDRVSQGAKEIIGRAPPWCKI